MPLIDLPLDELEQYQGRNPRPADFDAYWARALADLDATPEDVDLQPASFVSRAADAFDLTFGGTGGARVYAKLLVPKGASAAPAALMFHGYSANSGDWADKLSLVSEGFVVAALDVRGQAGLPEVDLTRVCSVGGSQGGGLALACAALEPSIARVATLYPFLCDWLRVWELDLAVSAYDGLRQHLRLFDPLHERKDEFFTTMGYIDVQHLAPRIRGEVLMVIGLMDEICPPSTQFAAYNKISSPKQRIIYPDYGHEAYPGWNDIAFGFLRGV